MREIGWLRHHHAMAVLGVPHVVVLEPVHVHVEPSVRVQVDVGNEPNCAMRHQRHHPANIPQDCIVSGTSKVRKRIAPTGCFFV